MAFACSACGHRQASSTACERCGDPSPLDLDKPETVEFLRDIDLRLKLKRQGRIRGLAVGGAMVLVFLLWLVPGYWDLRGTVYPGLPLFADQWMLMTLVAFGLIRGLDRVWGHQTKFPYVSNEPVFQR